MLNYNVRVDKSLLQTKLYIPPTRPDHINRPRLTSKLDEGLINPRALMLISAPAGYGKTSILVEWVQKSQQPVAWFSVDKFDNEPGRFFSYLFSAVQTVIQGLGEKLQGQLQGTDSPSPLSLMTAFINEFTSTTSYQWSESGHQLNIVLDDYHSITEPTIHESLDFLLERLPPQMHVVIVTRQDPPLALARLRARGLLTEIRQADLRFSTEESVNFLTKSMGIGLSRLEIETLTQRTEGWAAGLQLAGLSMQGLDDVTRHQFIAGFSGRHHFILDYLTDEVLKRQPMPVQDFLLHTSILDRMCSDLCDAVLEGAISISPTTADGSQKLLEHLETSNLFIVSLDNERRWYRYHHLFAELLRARLRESQPGIIPELHHQAALWYEKNGFMAQAVSHEFLTGDMNLAAELIGRAIKNFATWSKVEVKTVLRWLQSLPEEVVRNRPWLRLFTARSLYVTGQLKEAGRTLERLELWLKEHPDSPDTDHLLGLVRADRASYAVVQGEVGVGIAYAQRSLEKLPENDSIGHMRAQAILGLAYSRMGDVASAEKALSSAIDLAVEADLSFGAAPLIANMADVQIAQGKLNKALGSCEYALGLGTVNGRRVAPTGFACLEKGKILYERNRLQEAEVNFSEALDLLSQGGITQSFGNVHAMQALVQQAQGHPSEALTLSQEAVDQAKRGGIERLTVQAKAYQARMWLAQGATGRAVQWADEYMQLESVEYLREFEDLTLAQVHLALDRPEEALALLDTLLVHAESYDRINSVIHIAVLRALALDNLGETEEALHTLRQVLNLAMPERYRRVFLNQGLPMAHLLYQLSLKESDQAYIAGLLGDFEKDPAFARVENVLPETESQLKPSILVEPLSQREAEVLALLAGGLSNREIADRLVLSPHTIRSHTYNLYGKLGVHSRTQAVARARELGLLA